MRLFRWRSETVRLDMHELAVSDQGEKLCTLVPERPIKVTLIRDRRKRINLIVERDS